MQKLALSLSAVGCALALTSCGARAPHNNLKERFEIRLQGSVLFAGETSHADAVKHRKHLKSFNAASNKSASKRAFAASSGGYAVKTGSSYTAPKATTQSYSAPALSLSYSAPSVSSPATPPGYTYVATDTSYGTGCNIKASLRAYVAAWGSFAADVGGQMDMSVDWESFATQIPSAYACYVTKAIDCMTPKIRQLVSMYNSCKSDPTNCASDSTAIAESMQTCVYSLPGALQKQIDAGNEGGGSSTTDGTTDTGGGSGSGSVVGSCQTTVGTDCMEFYNTAAGRSAYNSTKTYYTCTTSACSTSGAVGKCTVMGDYMAYVYYSDATTWQSACGSMSGTWSKP